MEIQGQILETTEFAKQIDNIIKNTKHSIIVEIGTWKGLGSTKRILDSISNVGFFYSPKFISLESNFNFYNIAKNNLIHELGRVELINGRIIDFEDYVKYVETLNLTGEHVGWMQGDLNDYKDCSNVYSAIPETIDFLLLDGGEFSTYLEWELLRDRTSIVALDDTKMEKTKRIVSELTEDDNYKLLSTSDERHGFHIFERIG